MPAGRSWELLPDTKVLMLTASTEEDAVVEAVAAGATGYLQKYSGPDELADAVREVAEGRLRIPDSAIRRVFALIRGQRELTIRRALDSLTTREREVLKLFASGSSYAEIAGAGGNSTVTVRNTVYRIQAKLRINSKQELVVWAVRNGLLDDVAKGGLTRTVQRRRPSWTGSYSTWDHASTPFKPAMILRTGRVVTGVNDENSASVTLVAFLGLITPQYLSQWPGGWIVPAQPHHEDCSTYHPPRPPFKNRGHIALFVYRDVGSWWPQCLIASTRMSNAGTNCCFTRGN